MQAVVQAETIVGSSCRQDFVRRRKMQREDQRSVEPPLDKANRAVSAPDDVEIMTAAHHDSSTVGF